MKIIKCVVCGRTLEGIFEKDMLVLIVCDHCKKDAAPIVIDESVNERIATDEQIREQQLPL